jgi:uncharacterized membrane protein (DUF373 family)
MVIWDFGAKAIATFQGGNAASGFFHAFGSLFVLWTLSTLISAEVNYLQTGHVFVRVFVEVAMITVIREIIVHPVEAITSSTSESFGQTVYFGLLLVALLVIGVVYKLVGKDDKGDEHRGKISA